MARKKKVNPNTDKSRARYDLLKRVAKAIFPTEEEKLGGSKILTQFTEALYLANGLRYLRWGGDGEAVQPEKC
jgi:hypothetical protein